MMQRFGGWDMNSWVPQGNIKLILIIICCYVSTKLMDITDFLDGPLDIYLYIFDPGTDIKK